MTLFLPERSPAFLEKDLEEDLSNGKCLTYSCENGRCEEHGLRKEKNQLDSVKIKKIFGNSPVCSSICRQAPCSLCLSLLWPPSLPSSHTLTTTVKRCEKKM